jgi:hypothetical protein
MRLLTITIYYFYELVILLFKVSDKTKTSAKEMSRRLLCSEKTIAPLFKGGNAG